MRILRIGAILFCLLPGFSLAQKREFVELQRDIATLQDQVRNLERNNSENMGRITGLLQQAIDSINKLNTSVAVLDASIRDRDKTLVAPVTSVGARVDQMSGDFQALKVSIDDLSSRLGKMQQNLVDLNNTIKVIQAPPAPPSMGPGAGPGSASNAPCIPAETLYSNAMRDRTGSPAVALQEFNDYLRCYANTELAPNAQYYIGEIQYNNKEYESALEAFDAVLERFPENNNKRLDAMYMKGRTLFLMGERTKAADEFRSMISTAPRSEQASKAKAQLAGMGLSASPKRATKKR